MTDIIPYTTKTKDYGHLNSHAFKLDIIHLSLGLGSDLHSIKACKGCFHGKDFND